MADNHVDAASDHQQPIGQRLLETADENDCCQRREYRAKGNNPSNSKHDAKDRRSTQSHWPRHRQQHTQPAPAKFNQIERLCPNSTAIPARQTAHGAQICKSTAVGGVEDNSV
jgi:hypothetical protein